MHTFKDSKAREWQLKLTFGRAKAIKEKFHLDIGNEKDLQRVFTDREAFYNVCELLLSEQIAAAGVTDEDLMESFDGETWQVAMEALEAEIYFFSPNRKITDKIIPAIKKRQESLAMDYAGKIEAGKLDPQIERLILSKSATGSPESSAPPILPN